MPPAEEQAIGLRTYLTASPGIGGRLRSEPEDFQVIELGNPPTPAEKGKHSAARIRLRNWETNRFAGKAIRELRLRRGGVAFAGMKDKRAVTEQWFTFQCPPERVPDLLRLEDVEITDGPYWTNRATYAGAHAGNRFILRVREHSGDRDAVADCLAQIQGANGVPNWFGPQRFGAGVRPVTSPMGAAIVAGDLEEACRIYLGNPFPGEHEDAREARAVYEETRDPAAALDRYPHRLDLERSMLDRLVKEPGNWRWALQALPRNLLQLFVHSHQSRLFNDTVSRRIEAGLGVTRAHVGDRVMGADEDGTQTVLVTPANQARVQAELDKGRAVLTAPLVGLDCPMAEGAIGELEQAALAEAGIDTQAFRCRELPEVASQGRRRAIHMHVNDLTCEWVDGDPVVGFSLGRGAYATVVMREIMKAPLGAY